MEVTTLVYLCLGPVIVVVLSSPLTSGANLTHHQHMAGCGGSAQHTGGVIALYRARPHQVSILFQSMTAGNSSVHKKL